MLRIIRAVSKTKYSDHLHCMDAGGKHIQEKNVKKSVREHGNDQQ